MERLYTPRKALTQECHLLYLRFYWRKILREYALVYDYFYVSLSRPRDKVYSFLQALRKYFVFVEAHIFLALSVLDAVLASIYFALLYISKQPKGQPFVVNTAATKPSHEDTRKKC